MEHKLIDEFFDVDIENGKFYWKKVSKHHPDLLGKEAGCLGGDYWIIQINKQKIKRGRLLFFYINKRFPNPCIDHINGIKYDDRISNLREVTLQQNNWNHKTRKKQTSLPMGIRMVRGKYQARISINKKTIYLGVYSSIEKASQIYKEERIKLYGQYSGY